MRKMISLEDSQRSKLFLVSPIDVNTHGALEISFLVSRRSSLA